MTVQRVENCSIVLYPLHGHLETPSEAGRFRTFPLPLLLLFSHGKEGQERALLCSGRMSDTTPQQGTTKA